MFLPSLLFFWQYWGLNSGPCSWLARALPLQLLLLALFFLFVIFQLGYCVCAPSLPGLPSFYLCLSHSWDDKRTPPLPACLLRRDLANFLVGLALNCGPPNLSLTSSWDSRHQPLCLAPFLTF
jgi:hypothetical protein